MKLANFQPLNSAHQLICIALLTGLITTPVCAQQPAKPSLSVTTTSVKATQWATTLQASGQIAAWQEAIVSAKASGLVITALLVEQGAQVRRGQTLARFDDRAAKAEVAQARASLNQAGANAHQAVVNRDRIKSLESSGAVSDQDILQAVTQANTALAQKEQAQAALAAAQVRLENTIITAPDHGVISSRVATLGQVANPGTELFRMIRQNRLEWRAEIPAQQLSSINVGQSIKVTLPDNTMVTGKVRQLSTTLDTATRMGLAYADLQPGSAAKAAMYVRGEIQLGTANALVVPAESVVTRDGRPYVFIAQQGKAQRVAVTVGRRQGQEVEIKQGVTTGQPVIVRGAGFLSDGELVQVNPSKAGQ